MKFMKKLMLILLVGVLGAATAYAQPMGKRTFVAHLSGAEEVPAVETLARGQSVLQLSRDGERLEYRLMVANIENVTQAHIHLGFAGTNGPVVAWLYPPAPPLMLIPGRFDGVLAAGALTAADLRGPLMGMELSALMDAIRNGEAYVNVHTLQYPPGEIRGQIR